ncbi:MAG: adenylosuccinate lyase [Bacteroidota bacterium]
MKFHALESISPIDGRYRSKLDKLADYFSEKSLIKYRLEVEILYLIALSRVGLSELSPIENTIQEKLLSIPQTFSTEDAETIKQIERITNHDVKAVEYFIKQKLEELQMPHLKEFVHFGLTSQDINNTAIPMSLQACLRNVLLPKLEAYSLELERKSMEWSSIPMLARTHGQAASPTKLGKEISVFQIRLKKQINLLKTIRIYGKFGGATGNFNAHFVAYPEVDWHNFAEQFLADSLQLSRSYPTTQIEHYDSLAELFDALKRINTILIDFSRDIWQYISLGYFTQIIKADEVGSSAMPHKVNPIDFENAEGNLGIANALFEHLSAKLPISRLQRDLTDSTVLRNIGIPVAHTYLALLSLETGLSKLQVNQTSIEADLSNNWSVVSEAIQTILRREGYDQPYEMLKELTRTNEQITEESIGNFIKKLEASAELKNELQAITPFNYTGK